MICQWCGTRLPRCRLGVPGPRILSHTKRCRERIKLEEEDKSTLLSFIKETL